MLCLSSFELYSRWVPLPGGRLRLPKYRKIPKRSPGADIFQRPFLRVLFLEGLIFGGAYLRREIWVYKSIGLALYFEVNLPFLGCFTLYLRAIFQVQAPGGLIHGGAYFRNFTVLVKEIYYSRHVKSALLFLFLYFQI